jgi:hypothetical protein
MIAHALTIVINEMNEHLINNYDPGSTKSKAILRNVTELQTTVNEKQEKEIINLTVVNIREEKALKNLPNYVRNDANQTVTYENQPVFLNFYILITASHNDHTNALLALSRVIRFFQSKNVFTQDNVSPESITKNAPANQLDFLDTFKLIFDLYSPTLEEVNHLWGTLGGKQYPFVIYLMRTVDLKFHAILGQGSLITEVVTDFYQEKP